MSLKLILVLVGESQACGKAFLFSMNIIISEIFRKAMKMDFLGVNKSIEF